MVKKGSFLVSGGTKFHSKLPMLFDTTGASNETFFSFIYDNVDISATIQLCNLERESLSSCRDVSFKPALFPNFLQGKVLALIEFPILEINNQGDFNSIYLNINEKDSYSFAVASLYDKPRKVEVSNGI